MERVSQPSPTEAERRVAELEELILHAVESNPRRDAGLATLAAVALLARLPGYETGRQIEAVLKKVKKSSVHRAACKIEAFRSAKAHLAKLYAEHNQTKVGQG